MARPTAPPGAAADAYRRRPWLAAYPASVPPALPVPAVPVTALLDDAAARHPDRDALRSPDSRLSYGELSRHVEALAAGLAGLGVGRGDRVALVLPDCPQLVVAALAALRLGAVVVPHAPRTPDGELARRLAETGSTVAVCSEPVAGTVGSARAGTALRHVVVTGPADTLPRPSRLRLRRPTAVARRAPAVRRQGAPVPYADLLRTPAAYGRAEPDPASDLALLAWTAGVTAPARAAQLPHAALVAAAHQVRAWLEPAVGVAPGAVDADPPVVLGGLPLRHPVGLSVGLTATLLAGGTLVLLPDRGARSALAAVERHRPTLVAGEPALFRALADVPASGREALSTVRAGVSVGPGLPPGVRDRVEGLVGGPLVEAYGLAEAGLTHAQPVDGPRRAGTVGLPLPGTRAVVVDPDDRATPVPVGTPGELAVTGPQVAVGYWHRPAETRAAATASGHHLTGDLAVMAADGTFTVLGRTRPGPGGETLEG